MSIRIGLLGCGEHSEVGHAVPLAHYSAKHPGAVVLVGACDLRRERAELFCQKYGFARAYSDMDAMLQSERLDVCIAVIPVEHIPSVGIRLLQAHVPCVVEKPLGPSIAEVEVLRDAARATNTVNMVSVNRRFMPLLKQGIEWTKSTGPLRYVRATMLRHQRTEPDFLGFTAIHALDTVRFIGGDFASSNIRAITPAAPHSFVIDIQFEAGIVGRVDVLPTSGMVEETYELIGDGFRCVVTSPFGPQRFLRCYQKNRLVQEEIADDQPEDVIFGFYGEAAELVDAFKQGRRPEPTIEDIFPSVQACFELVKRVENNPTSIAPFSR
ncbi:MAG: Gfo/Idh/MocA family oxidoreductase [Acidobacteriia bacterium]|nr:Gfo/Idh/MocA family oxidoreductase [Terriglobia bacterium]